MSNHDNWRDLPVWRCSEDDCRQQWATAEESSRCPFCHVGRAEPAGFTCGEVAAAADRFQFPADLPVHIPEDVPELVQLSTLPRELWEGLPVFHPLSQEGTEAHWILYDVGVVVSVYPDPDLPEEFQCRFVCAVGGKSCTLHYSATNLWVPKALAARLLARGLVT